MQSVSVDKMHVDQTVSSGVPMSGRIKDLASAPQVRLGNSHPAASEFWQLLRAELHIVESPPYRTLSEKSCFDLMAHRRFYRSSERQYR